MFEKRMPEGDRVVWSVRPRDREAEATLAEAVGVSRVVAGLLRQRGITTPQAACVYLSPSPEGLGDPSRLPDIDEAVRLINEAVDHRRTVLVHGDYDVDGLTATALLVRFLSKLGANVEYFVPHRVHDHYGLSVKAIEEAAATGASLAIAVDCGTRDLRAIARAQELQLPVIVIDHHEPGETLPPAAAIVNPKRADADYPNRELSAAGLAFQVARAVAAARGLDDRYIQRAFIDLAAMGTIADVVPLVGENRALAAVGLAHLGQTKKLGLQTLLNLCGITGRPLAEHVAFRLGPRINAAGRLADAHPALQLLLTSDRDEANRTALYLDSVNRQRQQEQSAICDGARAMIEREVDLAATAAIVLASESWHVGVVGIAASQMVALYGRPVILLAASDGIARGSGRSIPGFHLAGALDQCADLLVRHGGHAMAVGATLKLQNLEPLRCRLNGVARQEIDPEALQPRLEIDAGVELSEVTGELAQELTRMEPFGNGNPEPALAVFGAQVVDRTIVGRDGQHLKVWVTDGNYRYECIGFGLSREAAWLSRGEAVDLCFMPQINDFGGSRTLQLRLHAVRRAIGDG